MSKKNILIVEDDLVLSTGLKDGLELENFLPSVAKNLEEAQNFIFNKNLDIDLIILDLGLPDGSGLDLIKKMKKNKNNTPILILSAQSNELNKVIGLESGADDFLGKPFSLRELIARINAILRRSQKITTMNKKNNFYFEEFEFSKDSRELKIKNREIKLSFIEFEILKLLIDNINIVISREKLMDYIWEGDYIDSRSIDPHISRLRKKISPYGKLIKTIPNIGYKFKV